MKRIEKEEELYLPIKEFFVEQGYLVRSEVKNCDIAAIKDGHLVVVELKKHLSMELLAQGIGRQKAADLVYLAIPKPRRLRVNQKWKDTLHLLRRLELGLLLVNSHVKVEVALQPVAFDRVKSRKRYEARRQAIYEEALARTKDLNTGGSCGKKLVTAYREAAIFIGCCLEKHGELSPKKLRELGTDPKKTNAILRDNHYGWFERVTRGVYRLRPQAKADIGQYSELVDYYRQKVSDGTKT